MRIPRAATGAGTAWPHRPKSGRSSRGGGIPATLPAWRSGHAAAAIAEPGKASRVGAEAGRAIDTG